MLDLDVAISNCNPIEFHGNLHLQGWNGNSTGTPPIGYLFMSDGAIDGDPFISEESEGVSEGEGDGVRLLEVEKPLRCACHSTKALGRDGALRDIVN